MRILLLGNTGQLGWELERCLAPLGEVTAVDYPDIDLSDLPALRSLVGSVQPQVIFNAAAYTAVDRAEEQPELAWAVNAAAPGALAEAAEQIGAALVHYSTDYVFDGRANTPYVETDPPNPLGVYGASKLAGEQAVERSGAAHLIFRTAWVYSLRRDSFVTKVLGWARRQSSLKLVTDQVGSPTWARLLAEVSALLIAQSGPDPAAWVRQRPGLYHLAGDGHASRLEFGRAVLQADPARSEQLVTEILPARTADFPTPAARPLFSALDCAKFQRTFGLRLPPWQQALKLALGES